MSAAKESKDKLESALARQRNPRLNAVLHYAPTLERA